MVTLTGVSTDTGTVNRGTSSVSTVIADTTITVNDVDQAEGSPLIFTVTASSSVTDLEVSYETEPGTARTPADFTSRRDTLIITGISELVPGVGTASDTLNEGNETLRLRLRLVDPPDGVELATPTATGTITDDAADGITATVAQGQNTVTEGTTATFVVTLEGGTSTAPVVISYELDGTATADAGDYTAPSGKLTIRAGATTGTISVQTLDDGVLDRGETLSVTLMQEGSGTAGALTATASSGDIVIGDAGGGVTVTVKDTTVDEGETAMFTVELSGKVSEEVTFSYQTEDETPQSAEQGSRLHCSERRRNHHGG